MNRIVAEHNSRQNRSRSLEFEAVISVMCILLLRSTAAVAESVTALDQHAKKWVARVLTYSSQHGRSSFDMSAADVVKLVVA